MNMRLLKFSIFLTLAVGSGVWVWFGNFDQAVIGILLGPALGLAAAGELLAWWKLDK